ncbi:MAG TPA: adenylate/guanylate cyclase domain-containing protein [Anaerolineae bacterium]|nr:adenylate/guanylate cyclase domain-containing protein [Anaerolineae bacterium]
MSMREELIQAMTVLEEQRGVLGDLVINHALNGLQVQLDALGGDVGDGRRARKQATILFADVSGFTAMSETMDAEDVGDTMNALWERVDQAIVAHYGWIDKHIGDAVMAIWGAEKVRENDAEQAVRAGLAMQAAIRAFAIERGVPLRMRIGINTGMVLLGEVGTTAEFTAMGDTVNVASRLEHAAPVGGVLISVATYEFVRGLFEVEEQEPLMVKGKSLPLQTYVVKGIRPASFRVRSKPTGGGMTPMVGRQEELRLLKVGVRQAIQEKGVQMITVSGEAGLGKSRLLTAFVDWLDEKGFELTYWKGRSHEDMMKRPFRFLQELLKFQFQIRESDSVATVTNKLEAGMQAVLGEAETHIAEAHVLGYWVGFDFSESPHVVGIVKDAKQIEQRGWQALASYWRALVKQQPLILFLEDVHWADEESLAIIERLGREKVREGVLIVANTRPNLYERVPNWGLGRPYQQKVSLTALTETENEQLVATLLSNMKNVPDNLQQLIKEQSQGNPFYVEELVKMLIDERVIQKGLMGWTVNEEQLAVVRVPHTLTGILQARIERLPVSARQILQEAAVMGRLFWDGAIVHMQMHTDEKGRARELASVAPMEVMAHAQAGIGQLMKREMVFKRDESAFVETDEYLFKHIILQGVVYNSILKRPRQRYHSLVADWLMGQVGDRLGEYALVIGEHLVAAGRGEEAIDFWLKAQEEAFGRGHFGQIKALMERALAVAEQTRVVTKKGALWQALGNALIFLGEYDLAKSKLEASYAWGEIHEDLLIQTEAMRDLGFLARNRGDYAEAHRYAEAAVTQAKKLGAKGVICSTLYQLGWLAAREGRYQEAEVYFGESGEVAEEIGELRQLSSCWNGLGSIANMQDDLIQAEWYYRKSLRVRRQSGDRKGVGVVLGNLGDVARKQAQYEAAQVYMEEALKIARDIGFPMGEAIQMNNLGHLALAQGDVGTAVGWYREAVGLSYKLGVVPLTLDALAGWAGVWVRMGRAKKAGEWLGLVLGHGAVTGEGRATAVAVREQVVAKLGEVEMAAAMARGRGLDLAKLVETVV